MNSVVGRWFKDESLSGWGIQHTLDISADGNYIYRGGDSVLETGQWKLATLTSAIYLDGNKYYYNTRVYRDGARARINLILRVTKSGLEQRPTNATNFDANWYRDTSV